MKAYVGAMVILAEPCTKQQWLGRDQETEPDEFGYRIRYPDGYVSWSPKATFEEAYRELGFHERALVAEGR